MFSNIICEIAVAMHTQKKVHKNARCMKFLDVFFCVLSGVDCSTPSHFDAMPLFFIFERLKGRHEKIIHTEKKELATRRELQIKNAFTIADANELTKKCSFFKRKKKRSDFHLNQFMIEFLVSREIFFSCQKKRRIFSTILSPQNF